MPDVSIRLDGVDRSVTEGTTAAELFADDRSIVVARVGGELRDLAYVLRDGDAVDGVAVDSPDGLAVLRHSAAHVLAQAVQSLHPAARLGIGPPIENGFYYDFDVERPFTPGRSRRAREADAARSSRPANASPAGWSPRREARRSSPRSRTSSS